ncbi:MAG: class I SAM-dependent methyltransferase [Bradyrhizobium sp.]
MTSTTATPPSKSLAREALKRKLRAFWNAHTVYWEMIAHGSGQEEAIHYRQRAASFVPAGSRVLDVACGSGANIPWLREGREYFGVDISSTGLRRAENAGVPLACADADALPFADGTFDAVIATNVLEHSTDPVRTLGEMRRVVRPGGRVVLLGPAWDFPFWFPNSVRSKAAGRRWRLRYALSRFGRQFWAVLFGQLPFEIVEDPDAFHAEFVYDADAVYIVWTYEVIRLMERWNSCLIHWETDDPLLGNNRFVRGLKALLMRTPWYRRAGSTVLLVFER